MQVWVTLASNMEVVFFSKFTIKLIFVANERIKFNGAEIASTLDNFNGSQRWMERSSITDFSVIPAGDLVNAPRSPRAFDDHKRKTTFWKSSKQIEEDKEIGDSDYLSNEET